MDIEMVCLPSQSARQFGITFVVAKNTWVPVCENCPMTIYMHSSHYNTTGQPRDDFKKDFSHRNAAKMTDG